jgi:hypothetical protein
MRSWWWAVLWCGVMSVTPVASAMTEIRELHPPPPPPTGDVAVDLLAALRSAQPMIWRRVGQLPASVREHLATVPPNSVDLPMADAGAAFNATDARNPAWPNARFVFGGRNAAAGFVVFEIGGFVPAQRLVVYSLRRDQIVASCVYELRRWARDWPTLEGVLRGVDGEAGDGCRLHQGIRGSLRHFGAVDVLTECAGE